MSLIQPDISVLTMGQEYVMEALSGKTVLLVTHQVDFLPAFDWCLVSLQSTFDVPW